MAGRVVGAPELVLRLEALRILGHLLQQAIDLLFLGIGGLGIAAFGGFDLDELLLLLFRRLRVYDALRDLGAVARGLGLRLGRRGRERNRTEQENADQAGEDRRPRAGTPKPNLMRSMVSLVRVETARA